MTSTWFRRRRLSIALLCASALAVWAAAIPPDAAAQSGTCHDPVPDPIAAGWTVEATGGSAVQNGDPLKVIDASALPGVFVNVRCQADALFGGEITLTPRFAIDGGYAKDPDDQSLGIQVTINDGIKMIRAVVLEDGAPNSFKVVLVSPLSGTGYTHGISFIGSALDFTLRRLADGTGVLSATGPFVKPGSFTEVQQPLAQQPDTDQPGVRTIEFGTLNSPNRTTTNWETLGLPAPSQLAADVQPPIDADGSSTFKASRGVVPVKFTLTENGNPTCELSPATLRLTRLGGASPGPIDESLYTGSPDSGTQFRVTDCQYQYNLSPRPLGPGTYLAEILIDGAAVGEARFELK
jgi:hypothetical protein